MAAYEEQVNKELQLWIKSILKREGIFERTSKKLQTKINTIIPQKLQNTMTLMIKGLIKTVLFGMDYVPKRPVQNNLSLTEADERAKELIKSYSRLAGAEGAGTGAGGFFMGVADYPALIAIKMKFLFELAHIYGYSTKDYRERLFLLYVFQLAFSASNHRAGLLKKISTWDQEIMSWPAEDKYLQNIDWEQFQKEYRDAIDFRKTLQMLPGLGAVAGAWANYKLLEELGITGMNCFRIRYFTRKRLREESGFK